MTWRVEVNVHRPMNRDAIEVFVCRRSMIERVDIGGGYSGPLTQHLTTEGTWVDHTWSECIPPTITVDGRELAGASPAYRDARQHLTEDIARHVQVLIDKHMGVVE